MNKGEVNSKGPYRVLIVDDEPYNIRIIKLKFEKAGYDVITATNGVEGLKKFKQEHPHVVITDVKMPLMDGQEMCQSIEKLNKESSFLLIVITSTIDREYRLWTDSINNAYLVEKPFSPAHLLSVVREFFKEHP